MSLLSYYTSSLVQLVKRAVAITLLAIAVVLVALAAFIVLPAPHLVLLPLGVVAPELSPWLALVSGAAAVASAFLGRRRRLARAATVLAVIALLTALTPLVRAPFAIAHFDAAMTAALGPDPLRAASPALAASMRRSPFVIADFVRGYRPDSAVEMTWNREPRIAIYRRPAAGLQPAVVQIFPGAWQRGAPEDDAIVARMLASLGYVVFAIDYRLAPAARWPAQIEDVRSALRWIEAHGGEHGADVTRMALFGRSAGAHLALLAAYVDPPRGFVRWRRSMRRRIWPRAGDIRRLPIRLTCAGCSRPSSADRRIGTPRRTGMRHPSPSSAPARRPRSRSTAPAITSSNHASAACWMNDCAPPASRRSIWRFRGRNMSSTSCPTA
jgi:acetyl esterase/lipase